MGKGWKNVFKVESAQKKGQMFTKLAREISVAAKLGGPDPEGNARLKVAIAVAREASCPKDTIERAIKKGAGLLDDASQIEELTYEGLAPHGVGVIVECQTDNKNRTVSELRNIFRRGNGSLGEAGSCAWMFDRIGLVVGQKDNIGDPEEEAIEVSANEVEKNEDGSYSFIGSPTDLDAVRTALMKRGWNIVAAERSYRAKTVTDLTADQTKEVTELITELEDFDDSHRVYSTLP